MRGSTAVWASYDAIINTFAARNTLDYRVIVRLLKSDSPLTAAQADTLLDITKKTYCDNAEVYQAYLAYYSQHSDPQTLINKYNEHKSAPVFQNAADPHSVVIHALHAVGDISGMASVAQVLLALNRHVLTSPEYTSLLRHFASTDLAQCERWVRRLLIPLDVKLYNELIAAFAHSKNLMALELLRQMQSRLLIPTEETYAPLLEMACNQLLTSVTFSKILLNTRTKEACSVLLSMCVRDNQLAKAHELYTARKATLFSTTALNLLLSAYAKNGNVARGTALLHEMEAPDAVSFEIAANMYARASDSRGCRNLVSLMTTNGASLTPVIMLALLDVCVVHGDVTGSEKLFNMTRQRNVITSQVCDKMITLYSNIGDLQKAREMWELMVNEGVEASTNTYNLIIAAHAKQGQSAECTRFLEDMKARLLTPNVGTYAGMVSALVAQRNYNSSRKVFDEMKQTMPVTDAVGAIFQYCSMKSSLKNEGHAIS